MSYLAPQREKPKRGELEVMSADHASAQISAAAAGWAANGFSLAGYSNPLLLSGVLVVLSLIPLMIISLSSFVKLSVVLTIVRNAVGASQFPSGAVVTMLSLLLTAQIMAPVVAESWRCAEEAWSDRPAAPASRSAVVQSRKLAGSRAAQPISFADLRRTGAAGSVPLLEFLRRHTRIEERVFFAQGINRREYGKAQPLQGSGPLCGGSGADLRQCEIPGESYFGLASAFMISQLREAFAVGFMVYLPFLVIDLVVANILLGLGMMMLSPATVSLPFKLMLFVASDGWLLLCRGLMLSYQ